MSRLRLFIIDQIAGSPRSLFPVSVSTISGEVDKPLDLIGIYQSDNNGYLSIEIPTKYLVSLDSASFIEDLNLINKDLNADNSSKDEEALERLERIFSLGYDGSYEDFLTIVTSTRTADIITEYKYLVGYKRYYFVKKYLNIAIIVSSMQSDNPQTQEISINPNEKGQVFTFIVRSNIPSLNSSVYPSYIPNPDQLDRTISPNSFSIQPKLLIGQGECEEFLPNPLPEQVFKFKEILIGTKIPNSISSNEESLFEADVRWGAVLEIKTEWFPLGHALGEIKYSLGLAPAEEVKITVIDWERKDTATRTEGIEYSEELKNEQLRERSISDTMKAALKERQNSNSFSIGASASGGFGGVSASVSTAASWTNSEASRDTSASSMQALADSVSQASSNIRNMYSTVVVQVTQEEQEKVETRTVKNHNHAHALTILYYEILRQYRVKITPTFSKGLLFLKMKGLENEFTDELILSNYNIIKKNLLEPSFSSPLDLFQQINSGSTEQIKVLVGEANLLPEKNTQISFFKVKIDTDTADGNFNMVVLLKFSSSDIWFSYRMEDGKLEEFFSPYAVIGNLYSSSDLNFTPYFSTFHKPAFGLNIHDLKAVGLYYAPAQAPSSEINLTGVRIEYTTNNNNTGWEKIYDTRDSGNQGLPRKLSAPNIPGSADLPKRQMWLIDLPVFATTASSLIQQNNDINNSLNVFQSKAISNIKEHINENRSYYWRKIFLNRENNIYASEFDKITLTGSSLTALLDIAIPIQINVIGDYLVFEVPYIGYTDLNTSAISEIKDKLDINLPKQITYTNVSLPTRGVFAETKLSHCSAAEVIDETRFWKWHEAPDEVNAPDIAAVVTGSRSEVQNLTPSQMPNSNLTIINPAPAPDPGTGLTAGLNLLGSLGAFTQSQGDQQNVRVGMQGNLDNVRRIAELNAQLEMQRRSQQNVDQNANRIEQGASSGRITREQANQLHEQNLRNMVGADIGSGSNDNEQPAPDTMDTSMGNLVNHAIETGSDVDITDGNRSVSVKGGSSSKQSLYFDMSSFKTNIIRLVNEEYEFWHTNESRLNRAWLETDDYVQDRLRDYWLSSYEFDSHGQVIRRINSTRSSNLISNRDPWSSAFISYIISNAGMPNNDLFLHSIKHVDYIGMSIINKENRRLNNPFWGYRITDYAPQIGDIVCRSPHVNYDNVISRQGPTYTIRGGSSHSDFVVERGEGFITVIGGNLELESPNIGADPESIVNVSVGKRKIYTLSDGKIDSSGTWEIIDSLGEIQFTGPQSDYFAVINIRTNLSIE